MKKPTKYPRTQIPKYPMGEDDGESESARAKEAFWGFDNTSGNGELREEPARSKPYDLEERTAQFGEAIIRFAKNIPRGPVNNRLIGQLVGAGTSVGANYCEADDG